MSKLQEPFRYDYVGSFLRTEELKKATTQYNENKITKEVYDNIVNEEIAKLVAKQKELGYHVITDGEFRRTYWHLDFMWGFEGVAHEQTGSGVQFDGELASLEDTYLVGKIKAKKHPFVEYFRYLKQFEDENTIAKYTIPAPAQMFQQMIVPTNIETTRKYYATNEELIQDIGVAYQDVIKQFYKAGCRSRHFLSWVILKAVFIHERDIQDRDGYSSLFRCLRAKEKLSHIIQKNVKIMKRL